MITMYRHYSENFMCGNSFYLYNDPVSQILFLSLLDWWKEAQSLEVRLKISELPSGETRIKIQAVKILEYLLLITLPNCLFGYYTLNSFAE